MYFTKPNWESNLSTICLLGKWSKELIGIRVRMELNLDLRRTVVISIPSWKWHFSEKKIFCNRNQLSRNGGHSGVDSCRVIGRSRSSGSMTSQSFFQKPAGVPSPMGNSRPSNQASNSKSYKTAATTDKGSMPPIKDSKILQLMWYV